MRKKSPFLSTARSRQTGLVMLTGRLGALPAPGFLALLAALLLFAGMAAWLLWQAGPAQAQDGEPPEVDNLRCIAETDRIAFLWEAAEWSGGESASYDYVLTLPDGRVERTQLQNPISRTSLVLRSGSYPTGGETRFRVTPNYKTTDGKYVTGAAATLTCYIGWPYPLAITPGNTTRAYGETDAMSYTVSGLVDGDADSDVVTGNLGRAPGDDVGSYAINLGTLAIAPDYATKYALPASLAAATYTITTRPAAYTATGVNKAYDGTTAVAGPLNGAFAAGDLRSGDTVTVSGGTYAAADAGTGYAVTGSSVGGADAGNYAVTLSVSGDITPRAVTAISGVQVSSRLPDGTTTATFDTSGAQGTGVVASELTDFRAGGLAVSGAFPSASAGTHDVSVTYSLQDHSSFKAGNYALSAAAATATLRGEIQPRREVTVSGVRVISRLADGTTDATFDTSGLRVIGVLPAALADFRAGGLSVSGAFPSAEPGSYDVSVTYALQDHGSFKTSGHTLSTTTATLHGEIRKASGQSSAAACEPSAGDDYDADDDGLIEVCNLAQLSAVRFDLDGDGSASGSSIEGAGDSYEAAFPGVTANGSGCPQSGCKGYELTADLDFDTNGNGEADAGDAYWNEGKGWLPIGEYTAVFDGNDHSISNLYISDGERRGLLGERRGLFNELAVTGVIRNVELQNANVSGNGIAVGALVGRSRGVISGAGVNATVSGSDWVGGLVGYNYGTVEDSYSSGKVTGARSNTGGLIGQNYRGRVVRSYSTADVSAGGGNLGFGGLVGFNNGSIIASYATGQVSGNARRVGGLVGENIGASSDFYEENTGEIFASYATGDVSGTSEVGGLAGHNATGPISASYALGAVSGDSRVGGLVGYHSEARVHIHRCIGCILPSTRPGEADRSGVTASYWNSQAPGQAATQGLPLQSNWVAPAVDTSRTTAELRRPTGYDGIYALWDDLRDLSGASYAWDFGTSLDFPALRDTGPSVAAQRARMPDPPESTDPQPDSPPSPQGIDYDRDDDGLIEVWSLAQLDAIRYDMGASGDGSWDGYYWPGVYPNPLPGMGCPRSGCLGYELMTDLDFDTNGNGKIDPGDHYWNGAHHPDDSAFCIDWYKWHPRQEVRETPGACDDYFGNDGEGWRPLARGMVEDWYGIFEGNGHAIRNLYANTLDTPFTDAVLNRVNIYGDPTTAGDGRHNYAALFRGIGDIGVVRNLRLENVNVSGKILVGALAGKNHGIISNVHVTGSVSGISQVGGLVGDAKADSYITGSSSRANVAGRKAGGQDVGGLVGLNQGVTQASYARGAVSGWADNTGGLAGRNVGSIAASYATGPVSTDGRYAGGMVGKNAGSITASYSTGGATAGAGDAGGLAGSHDSGTITSAYWDTQASGQGTSAAGAGQTTAELQSPTGYAGIYANWNVDLDRDGGLDDPWNFGTASQYPVLQYGGSSSGKQREPFTAQALNLPRVGGGQQSSPTQEAPNQAPTVSGSLDDVTLASNGGTREVSLTGVFDDGDADSLAVTAHALTITAEPPPGHDGASYIEVVTVSVPSDYSALTLTGRVAGTAIVTVRADDGKGGAVSTAFVATVEAAATGSASIADATIANESGTHQVSLSGVFGAADGGITAVSSAETVATVSVAGDYSTLTVNAHARGTAVITVTAADGNGGTEEVTFTVTVKAAPVVASAISDVTGLEEGTTQDIALSGVFSDADNDALTITAASSNTGKATVSVASDGSKLTLAGVAQGTATVTVTAQDSDGNRVSDQFSVTVAAPQQQQQQQQLNQPPTVASAIANATIVHESGTQTVSLSGVFSDADSDSLTVTASSSDTAKATVSVAADYSGLTVTAKARGTATITVTADDGNGGTVDDTFTITVKAAPAVASAIGDVSGLEAGATRDVSLSGVFSDADNDALTITAASSDTGKATVSVAADGSKLTLTGVSAGTATITVTAQDADGNRVSDQFSVTVAAPQQQQQQQLNQAPTVASAIGDATIVNESGTHQVSLSGTFSDADSDSLTVTAASSNTAKATVSVAADYSGLTVTAKARGTATITVTADDGNGGTVDDTFTITVKAAPAVASAIGDVSGLEAGATRDVSLSGVFSDADNDALTITATSSNTGNATVSVAADGSKLTVSGVAQGAATITVTAQDSDGNTVSDAFDVTVAGPSSGAPSPAENLSCIARTDQVAFLWDVPEWSGGEVYAYDYDLTLPDGKREQVRWVGYPVVNKPGEYQAGTEASISVKVVYKLADGDEVSSAAATLTCTVTE